MSKKGIILKCDCGNKMWLSGKLERFSHFHYPKNPGEIGILPLKCNKCGKLIDEINAKYEKPKSKIKVKSR